MIAVIILLISIIVVLCVFLNKRNNKSTNHEEIIGTKIMSLKNGGDYKEFKSSPQERTDREKRQELLNKRDERRIRKQKVWLILRYMITYRQLVQSSTFYDFKKYIADHKYAIGELRKAHPDDYSFNTAIKFCRMEYYYGTCDYQLTEEDIKFVLNWETNDIDTHEILKDVLNSYKEYWDEVLASYVRPSARIKRFQYLIDDLDKIMDLPDVQEYPNILQGVKELQNLYQLQLNEMV